MEEQSEQDRRSARLKALIDSANERGIDWEPAIKGLQDDVVASIYTLATLLRLDIWDALLSRKPLSVLVREAALMESGEIAMRTRFESARWQRSAELNAQREE